MQLGVAPLRIDLLSKLAGDLSFRRAWDARVDSAFGAVDTHYISLEDLIHERKSPTATRTVRTSRRCARRKDSGARRGADAPAPSSAPWSSSSFQEGAPDLGDPEELGRRRGGLGRPLGPLFVVVLARRRRPLRPRGRAGHLLPGGGAGRLLPGGLPSLATDPRAGGGVAADLAPRPARRRGAARRCTEERARALGVTGEITRRRTTPRPAAGPRPSPRRASAASATCWVTTPPSAWPASPSSGPRGRSLACTAGRADRPRPPA